MVTSLLLLILEAGNAIDGDSMKHVCNTELIRHQWGYCALSLAIPVKEPSCGPFLQNFLLSVLNQHTCPAPSKAKYISVHAQRKIIFKLFPWAYFTAVTKQLSSLLSPNMNMGKILPPLLAQSKCKSCLSAWLKAWKANNARSIHCSRRECKQA